MLCRSEEKANAAMKWIRDNNAEVEEGGSKAGEESEAALAPAVVLVDGEAAADDDETHDPFYPPIVSLPLVEVPTGEDGETEIFKKRARLYR